MKNRIILILCLSLLLFGCAGVSSKGIFGTGVSIAFDPRSVGTQIDDSIMQKTLSTKIVLLDKSYILSVNSKVLDGRIFLTGKVDNPEEKLKLTKLAWEIEGVRSVRNDIKVKEKFNFQQSAKDILITSQLRTALIMNKNIKGSCGGLNAISGSNKCSVCNKDIDPNSPLVTQLNCKKAQKI